MMATELDARFEVDESDLLAAIRDDSATRKTVAIMYARVLRSCKCGAVDWGRMNLAIIGRWSIPALNYIDGMARSGKFYDSTDRMKPMPQTKVTKKDEFRTATADVMQCEVCGEDMMITPSDFFLCIRGCGKLKPTPRPPDKMRKYWPERAIGRNRK